MLLATRKDNQRKIKQHINDLIKRGIDPTPVTQGKTIEQLAWNSITYNNFMERKRIALRKDKKIKKQKETIVLVNSQGYEVNQYEYNIVKKLEDKYNKELTKQYNNYVKIHGKPTELVENFLKGKQLRHKNSNEFIQLSENFGNVNLLDRLNDTVNLDLFVKLTENKIKLLNYENMLDDYSDYFNNEYLQPLVDSMDLHEKERKKLLEYYKEMNIIERYQFNKDMKRVMAIIESDLKNPKSMYTPYLLMLEFMEKEYKREFIVGK